MAIGLVAIPDTAVAQTPGDEPAVADIGRVRSRHQGLRAMITIASEQSSTFRRMVETINASDGIVYVEPGVCKHGVRACLVKVTSAGGYRLLFVKVDIIRAEQKLIAAIGHELHHAIEVLSDPAVKDYSSMLFFYMNKGELVRTSNAFETVAAIKAGDTVAGEIGRRRHADTPRNRANSHVAHPIRLDAGPRPVDDTIPDEPGM